MKKIFKNTLTFLKMNGLYVMLAFCVLAVGLTAAFMIAGDFETRTVDVNVTEPQGEEGGEQEKKEEVVTFLLPVENMSGMDGYTDSMVYCSTLNRFETHLGIDYYAAEGSNVFAVYGGTVESVDNDVLLGTTITIDHGNGLKTVYNSLEDGDLVSVGLKVDKGDVIGKVSTTNRKEYKKGAHLHFEAYENGQVINPEKYLESDNK